MAGGMLAVRIHLVGESEMMLLQFASVAVAFAMPLFSCRFTGMANDACRIDASAAQTDTFE
jgi:hypothetical protein